MSRFFTQLQRGLSLRCPVCGRGKLFRSLFTMHKECPVCRYHYEREEGYFSGAMAFDLILSELLVTAIVIPLAANPSIPIIPLLLWTLPLAIILPIGFFWHSRGLWMSMDLYARPASGFRPVPEEEAQQGPNNTEIH